MLVTRMETIATIFSVSAFYLSLQPSLKDSNSHSSVSAKAEVVKTGMVTNTRIKNAKLILNN